MLATGGHRVLETDEVRDKKFSMVPYFVSAFAADYKLFYEAHWVNTIFGVMDILAHVTVWVIAMIYEANMLRLAYDMQTATPVANTQAYPYAYASFWTLLVPFIILVASTLFSFFSPITPKTYLPFLTSCMEGGLMASLIFTIVCALFTVGVAAATVEFRDYTIIVMTFKSLAMSFLTANLRRGFNMP